MGAANTCQINLGANSMTIERNPIASNVPEVIPYSQIESVIPVTYKAKTSITDPLDQEFNWKYRFDTMTVLAINLASGESIYIELQEVTNQATWNLGTLAALSQAVTDINAAL